MADGFSEEAVKLLKAMTSALADDDSSIKIDVVSGDHTTVFSISSNREELGKLIGRSGKHAHAIRAILSAFAAKCNRRAVLEIADERRSDDEDYNSHPRGRVRDRF